MKDMLITSMLIPFGTWLGEKLLDKGFEEITAKFKEDETNSKFNSCLDKVIEQYQSVHPDLLGGSFKHFFGRKEVCEELYKLLFINSKVNVDTLAEYFDISTLPENFLKNFVLDLRNELNGDIVLNEILANQNLYISIQGITKDVASIEKNSNLTLIEIKSIRELLTKQIEGSFDADKFIKQYSQNAINNLSQVLFLGLGINISVKRNRKELKDIYVAPNFSVKRVIRSETEDGLNENDEFDIHDEINFFNLFDEHENLVILGNPGSGKSFLIKALICDILEKNKHKLKNQNIFSAIPFRIELRKYLAFKKNEKGNLIGYLCILLDSEYSINGITDNIIVDFIQNRKCIFFFDGLDEIFDLQDKNAVKNDIENFHSNYKIFSVTTSRTVGYDEAKFCSEKYLELQIENFDKSQIKEYVEKWYVKEEENEEIRRKEIDDFISKMDTIDIELLSNPLLLSLIVILYRNILKLPESKLEIYESCTKTLVDKWDASKDLLISINDNLKKSKEKLLSDLAYWQYEQLSSENTQITYSQAKRRVAKSIFEKLNITDFQEADEMADSFLEYAQKRSIYFDNNFTHKTFLEYYTAFWIFSNLEKKYKIEERNQLIEKYIDNPFWHIVIELLLNMIDKDQADSEVMDQILSKQVNANWKALLFVISTINSFNNVSTSCKREILEISLIVFVRYVSLNNIKNNEFRFVKRLYRKFLESTENEEFYSLLIEQLNNLDNSRQDITKEIYLIYADIEIFKNKGKKTAFGLLNKAQFENIKSVSPSLFMTANLIGNVDNQKEYVEFTKQYLKLFGKKSFFTNHTNHLLNSRVGCMADYFLHFQLMSDNLNSINDNLEFLRKLKVDLRDLLNYKAKNGGFYALHLDELNALLDRIRIVRKDEELKLLLYRLLTSFYSNRIIGSIQESELDEKIRSIGCYDRISFLFEQKDLKKAVTMLVNLNEII